MFEADGPGVVDLFYGSDPSDASDGDCSGAHLDRCCKQCWH